VTSGFVIVFDYPGFRRRYAEFNDTVNADLAQEFFNEATLYFRNDGSIPVSSESAQRSFLNMLVAHIAQLNVGSSGNPASAIVGRVTNASEGSVSVAATMENLPGTAAWFSQTRYGISFWQATAAYRTMHYRAGPRRVVNPFPFR
jgi:hypothetical protein